MIRHAVPADRAAVIGMLRDFHAEYGLPFPFDPAYAARFFANHCQRPDMLLLVDDDAFLFGMVTPHPFGDFRIALEVAWWIAPARRGGALAARMLDAYEAWARENGARIVTAAGKGADPRVGRMYERRGYAPAETSFMMTVA